MPLYTYKCPVCAQRREVFKAIADLDRVEECDKCNFAMNRQLSAPMVRGDYAGYTCPVTGDWVEGRRAHQENLAKHGCRVFETGEREEFLRRKASEDQQFERSVEETVEAAIEQMPGPKREQLAAELRSGVDAQVVRI